MASEEDRRNTISVLLACRITPTEISNILECSCSTVYRVMERGPFKRDSGVRPRPRRSENLVSEVEEASGKAQGRVSMRALGKDFGVPETTMRCLVKEDLGLKCLQRLPRMFPSDGDTRKRVERWRSYSMRWKKSPVMLSSSSLMRPRSQ